MDILQLWGLDLIRSIQQFHGPILDGLFRAITFLGTQEAYLLVMPFIMWCIDFRVGVRLIIVLLFSSYLNTDLKDLFQQPRPFQLDPGVKLADATGYSLPSGHAQSAVVVWGGIAVWLHATWFWVAAILLIILIGFSRIYLGVHFPTDVLAGWAIGAGLLGIFLVTRQRIQRRLEQLHFVIVMLLATTIPIALILIHSTPNAVSAPAIASGLTVGLALASHRNAFSVEGIWQQRLFRYVIGMSITLGLYFGLGAIFPAEGETFYLVLRFVRYWMVGLWISLGGPWFFHLLKLSPGQTGKS
ncbi:MAG: phosphatase PAP2 family protein [Dehalococcoidia bacterium]|nr:phosphatase PAP2 family protein [Dehalococcoidia bacterium]